MNFINTVAGNFLACLSKYSTFSGRATRAEYWSFTIICVAVDTLLTLLGEKIDALSVFNGLLSLALFVPQLAVFWRRMHDIGKPGTWYFLGFVPIVGQIVVFVWLCRDSQPEANVYGPNPKPSYPVYADREY